MKKTVLLVLMVLLSTALFAQVVEESNYSYVNYPIFKILQDKQGFVILTPKADRTMQSIYLPMEWFKPSVDKAKFVDKRKQLSPVLTVFYRNGEFERAKVVVPKNKADVIWGLLPNAAAHESKFNQDKLYIE